MDFIGALAPQQVVKIRFGRLSRYFSENPAPYNTEDGITGGLHHAGAGHQEWDSPNYPYGGVVGTTGSNPFHFFPWQAMWIPATEYVVIPNVLEVKKDKKLESEGIGGIESVTIEIENILYALQGGGHHLTERGAMSPLRGYFAHGDEGAPDIPQLLNELAEIVGTNEWEGRFAYAAQVTILQGYGEQIKTFTGLVEDVDTTSRPEKITLTARDFGLIFTETHFFGWGKDPEIATPVAFVDSEEAATFSEQGYNPHASSEAVGHPPSKVLDFDITTFWKSVPRAEDETEFVEIALPQGKYRFADIRTAIFGMDVYVSLRAADIAVGDHPRRVTEGEVVEELTVANKRLDKEGWVDLGFILHGEPESQRVPGAEGGNSYTNLIKAYPSGAQRTPIEPIEEGETAAAMYEVGANSVLRLSFRKLNLEAGKYYATVEEMHGLRQAEEEGAGKAQWVMVDDISDVIKTLCIWAGFKEWDIDNTGAKLPVRITAHKGETYMDIVKQVCEGIGWNFYMKDPTPDGSPMAGPSIEGMGGSLGVPTFKRSLAVSDDDLTTGGTTVVTNETFTGSLPTVKDTDLVQAIQVKQTNEPLSYIMRVYGRTKSLPGDQKAAIESGKLIVYTFRPPWTGTPPTYADTRLGGVLKQLVHYDPLLATIPDLRNACFLIALEEALNSVTATVEVPFLRAKAKAPAKLQPPDLEDHLLLMDLSSGITTRMAIRGRSSTFIGGEAAHFVVTFEGTLIDTPDVRGMVNIINGVTPPNGEGAEWANPKTATASELGYG